MLGTAGPSGAAVRTVTTLNDSGPGSLRDTIAASSSGDTIAFAVAGTITLTSGHLTIGKNLTLDGPGPDALAISGDNARRGFFISAGTVTIAGLKIRNCVQTNGAAMHVASSANVTLFNCIVQSNRVIASAAQDSPLGCVQVYGRLTMVNSTFTANSGSYNNGTKTVEGRPGSTLTINQCTFLQNHNTAVDGWGSLTINNSTFYKNGWGAIIVHGSGTITSCSIVRNDYPGGIIVWGSVTIRNTISAHNDRYLSSSGNVYSQGGTVSSQGYNLATDDANGLLNGPNDRINTDPRVDPYGVQYHGGYNGTIALTSGSPAIDQGRAFGLSSDQRGYARTVDNPEALPPPGGDGTDIGAYEAPADALHPGNSPVVTTLADHDDGVCGAGDCTLREAIARANAVNSSAAINFAPGLAGTITLNRLLGELVLTASSRINGPGARTLTVSGGGYIRILNVVARTSVTISGLTLREGWQFSGGASASNQGGAINNLGFLTLNDCAFARNYAAGQSAGVESSAHGGTGRGGAIYNAGTLTLNRCLFSDDAISGGNTAAGGAGGSRTGSFTGGGNGGAAQGGAIFNDSGGTLNMNNCTFRGNSASGGAGGSAHFGGNGGAGMGGAIYSLGTMTMTACTISGNTGTGGSAGRGNVSINDGIAGTGVGGIASAGTTPIIANTLCAANAASGYSRSFDVQGSFGSAGYNLVGSVGQSTGFNASTDQTGTDSARLDPRLGALQNDGGPTHTMSPLPGSPAIDRGKRFELTTDQRGIPRPIDDPGIANALGGDGSDIGAVEFVQERPQSGTGLVVTTVADHDDGACSYLDCTLREAIHAANAIAGPNTITFAPTVTGHIVLTNALPEVNSDMHVRGPGAQWLAVRGNNTHRVFTVLGGSSMISGLTIADGLASTTLLGGSAGGAGVFNSATLSIIECALSRNRAEGSFGFTRSGGNGNGGAIYNSGVLTLNRCTLSHNTALGGGGGAPFRGSGPGAGGAGNGGAIFNDTGGLLSLAICTVAANSGTGGRGGDGDAVYAGANGGSGHGGIFNRGTLAVTACTMSANTGTAGAGGVGNGNGVSGEASGGFGQAVGLGTNTVRNTIVANNFASGSTSGLDVLGLVGSGGYNLLGSALGASGFNATGDQVNVDPRLGPLQDNGGSTETMVVFLNSAALDKGRGFGLASDQRGLQRTLDSLISVNAPGGDGTDIGAFELNPAWWDVDGDSNSDPDTDMDGMPDFFESFYGFNLHDPADGAHDTDGDGLKNQHEFLAGTNPRDPASSLRITAVQRTGNTVVVTFGLAVPDHAYRLEYRNSVSEVEWRPILGVPDYTTSSAGQGQITDPSIGAAPSRFYHIRLIY